MQDTALQPESARIHQQSEDSTAEIWQPTELPWMRELVEMGFDWKTVQRAVAEHRSGEEVLRFLVDEERVWEHSFMGKSYIAKDQSLNSTCLLCGDQAILHHANPQSSAPIFFCIICWEPVQVSWTARDCTKHSCCLDCAKAYVQSVLDQGKPFSCPWYGCHASLREEEVRELVGLEISSYWEMKRLQLVPNYRHCPAINCPGFILGSSAAAKVECQVCALDLCSHCGRLWHADIPCEIVSQKELHCSQFVKACPRCHRFIEKSVGCDHLICPICSHEWCWQCLLPFKPTHFLPGSADYCPFLQLSTATEISWRQFSLRVGVACCAPVWLLAVGILFILLTLLLFAAWPCFIGLFVYKSRHTDSVACQVSEVFLGLLAWPIAPLPVGAILTALIIDRILRPEPHASLPPA